MQVYKIQNYPDYELHYSKEEQLVYSKKRGKYLKLVKNRDGYLLTRLYKNGKQKCLLLHRLVWICLKGEIANVLQINHMDENKENNCIENLELVTHLENCNYGTRNERVAKAMIGKFINRQDQSKSIVGIKKDLSEILHYPSAKEAERDRGFNNRNISSCCNNKRYKSVQDFIWFFKSDFDSYLTKFNNDLEKLIEYKKTLRKNDH